MRIGYSFWGFLFAGVADTPDGGRSHRLPFLQALISIGVEVVCLQPNRDEIEADTAVNIPGIIFSREEFPDIDALFCEYRWPIPGRNTAHDVDTPGFTPDLVRQDSLIRHYSGRVPIIIWDKDLKVPDPLTSDHIILEAGIAPRTGRSRLLFSFDPMMHATLLRTIDSYSLSNRKVDLIYIGNQYERDDSFDKYINKSGIFLDSRPVVYGNWTKYPDIYSDNQRRFPFVAFKDRLHFKDVGVTYRKALCTVLLAPQRYYECGQITQRIFEALTNHVIPLVPTEYRHIDHLILPELWISSACEVQEKIRMLRGCGEPFIRDLLQKQADLLKPYSPALQADTVMAILKNRCRNVY